MSELGIFIDESGVIDFKSSNMNLNDLYIVSFLFHDKSRNIDNEVTVFENFLLEYRLLQCADMVCSLELINQRKQNNEYIKAIEMFFISNNKYNKNYAKTFKKLEL